MEIDLVPSQGLGQIIDALTNQIDATRQHLSKLQAVKEKKETLLQTAEQVLHQHCQASWGGPELSHSLQATVTTCIATPAGWEITVDIHGLPELSTTTPSPTITISATHPSVPCTVRQLRSSSWSRNKKESPGANAVALIQLHGAIPSSLSSTQQIDDDKVEVHVLLTSPEDGAVGAAVPAGRMTLDSISWMKALAHPSNGNSQFDTDMGNNIITSNSAWPCVSHFEIKSLSSSDISGELMVDSYLEEFFIHQLGCERRMNAELHDHDGTAASGACIAWTLGNAAEVVFRASTPAAILSIYATSEVLLSTLKTQVESHVVSRISSSMNSSGAMVAFISIADLPLGSIEEHPSSSNGVIIKAVDSLIAELESLGTWVIAVKQQCSEQTTSKTGNGQQLQNNPLSAQTAALHAMIETDRRAAEAINS